MARQQRMLIPWRRVITAIIATFLLSAAALLWILNNEHIIQGDWSNILPIFFTALGVIFAFLVWLFPFSPGQPEAFHLPLASELVPSSFKMGNDAAAKFPYITSPIQNAYNAATRAMLDSSNGSGDKLGILILGEANAGKTRLAFEVLTKTLPNWPVLRWRPDYTINKVPTEAFFNRKGLVIFIDDLQDYVPIRMRNIDGGLPTDDSRTMTLRTLVETLLQDMRRIVLIVTCRFEDETAVRAGIGQLFTELTVIPLRSFNVETHDPETAEIIANFQEWGSTHIEDWDGTLGSLVLGLSTKNNEYLKIRNELAAMVLRAMKLLTRAYTWVHTEQRLRAVCVGVFGEKSFQTDEKTWQEAVNLLVQEQFVTEELDEHSREAILVIRKDTYFDQVITDYPAPNRPHQLEIDFMRLQQVLVGIRDADALVSLGHAFTDFKRFEEALASYEQAIRLDQNHFVAYSNKGSVLIELKRYQEALEASEQALRLEPRDVLAYSNKGFVLIDLKRFEEALEANEQALRLLPNLVTPYINKGVAFRELKRYQEALEANEQALRLDPKDVDAYVNRGSVLTELKRYEEALASYEQAIRLDPNDTSAYLNKGSTLSEMKRWEEAFSAYEQATRLDPNNAVAYVNRGSVLAEMKRYEEALASYEQAIRLDPDDALAYNNIGEVLVRLRCYEEALVACEQAIQLNPNYVDAYINKGDVLTNLMRYEEALSTYDHALILAPGNETVWIERVKLLRTLGHEEEAQLAEAEAKKLDR